MKHTLIAVGILAASCSLTAGRAQAQSKGAFAQQDFSATMVTAGPNGQQISMKVYHSGDKMRTDMPGGKMHSLLLMGQNKFYMVMPQMCMEMPQQRPDPFGLTGTVERKELGSDTVDGHPTKIEQITITPAGGGTPVTMKAWEATDLKGFPLRVEMPSPQGTMTIDYKDVDLSTPPASLFAVPNGCRTMPMMPGMPHPGN
jgi:outer membrane lipoprotein-sorting protein